MESHLSHLRSLLTKQRVIPVVGTGVSYWSTDSDPGSTWTGLLADAIDYVSASGADLPNGWQCAQRTRLESGTTEALIGIAAEIVDLLGGHESGRYREWLRRSIGRLRVSRADLIEEVGKLGRVVATTNYDGLIEEAIGGPAVTWLDRSVLHQVITGDNYGVLHLHGYWENPESVVFDARSYDRITQDEFAQAIIRSLAVMHSFLFIGFGSGLHDPNFSRLRAWMRTWAHHSPYGHFRLVRSSDLSEISAAHPPEERIIPIVYGDNYSDLPGFLADLTGTHRYTRAQPPPKRRWRMLESATFPLVSDSQQAVTGLLYEFASGLLRAFGPENPVSFSLLYRLEERVVDGEHLRVMVVHSHQPRYLKTVQDRYRHLITEAIRHAGLDAEERARVRHELAREGWALMQNWRLNFDFEISESFYALQVALDPAGREISLHTVREMSVNPADYAQKVRTTSELFGLIAGYSNVVIGVTDMDALADNPRLLPLWVDVLDHKGIDWSYLRFDADAPEEWIYLNEPFSQEIGEFLSQ